MICLFVGTCACDVYTIQSNTLMVFNFIYSGSVIYVYLQHIHTYISGTVLM